MVKIEGGIKLPRSGLVHLVDLSDFQVSGFNALTMTYLNTRSALPNHDITGFTWLGLTSRYYIMTGLLVSKIMSTAFLA